MEFKATINQEQEIEGRTVSGYASIFGNIDAYRDIVHFGAFRKTIKENRSRVRHLWMHDAYSPPTAAITELKEVRAKELPESITEKHPEVTGGLRVSRTYLETPRGEEILAGIKAGVINEMSFGFDPVKWDREELKDDGSDVTFVVRNVREVRLWDTSDVVWGANPLTVAASKSAISFKSTGKAPLDVRLESPKLDQFTGEAWDDLDGAEKARIASHFLHQGDRKDFASLTGLHHAPAMRGTGPAVLSAVQVCMKALMDGSGDIPDSDLYSVYSHLAKHYEEFGLEAPSFKVVSLLRLSSSVKFVPAALIFNERLTDRQAEKANDLLAELRGLLTAEPVQVAPESLTQALSLKLAILEHEFNF